MENIFSIIFFWCSIFLQLCWTLLIFFVLLLHISILLSGTLSSSSFRHIRKVKSLHLRIWNVSLPDFSLMFLITCWLFLLSKDSRMYSFIFIVLSPLSHPFTIVTAIDAINAWNHSFRDIVPSDILKVDFFGRSKLNF